MCCVVLEEEEDDFEVLNTHNNDSLESHAPLALEELTGSVSVCSVLACHASVVSCYL